jgi:alanyl-tRNA synthetase
LTDSLDRISYLITAPNCVIGAFLPGQNTVLIGREIPVRRGAEGWYWLIVHVVDLPDIPDMTGMTAELAVDQNLRTALSAAHTASELVTLALNEALMDCWCKEMSLDTLGNPNFDQLAIDDSRIHPYGSRVNYRIGRTVRKNGFVTERLVTCLTLITEQINDRIAKWIEEDAPVWVHARGPELSARREWRCDLQESEVSVPCGGTHLNSTGQLGSVLVTLELSKDERTLSVHSAVQGQC